jgi:hypothetical protein
MQPTDISRTSFLDRNKLKSLLCVCSAAYAIDGKECVGDRERRPFVAVYKRVVLRQALPHRCGFFDQIGVIPGLEPVERGFEETTISDTWAPP